jgi:hypothetical protein
MPIDARERRPGPDRWSPAEIVDHLAIVEERLHALIGREIDAARSRGLGVDSSRAPIGATLTPDAVANRTRRISASAASQPRAGIDLATARARLDRAREETRRTVLSADGLALGEIVLAHPVFGDLNLYEWVLFIAGHERRHTLQIREAADAVRSV